MELYNLWFKNNNNEMRIKKFNEMADFDLASDIAKDLFPKLQQKRSQGEIITPDYFEKFMKENGGDLSMTDAVMGELVDMGFDFDIESED
jgi:hypothetical protein